MNKELYVSSTPHETRLALAEDGEIAEVYFEREKEYSLAGAIYKGRVTRVLPGMQSAFVDIGLERDAFLYVSDFFEDSDEYDRVVSEAENAVARLEKPGTERLPAAPVSEVLAAPMERRPPAPGREGGRDSGRGDGRENRGEPRGDGRGGDDRGRRGRMRGRRGRTNSIPDSKFANPNQLEEMPAPAWTPDTAEGTEPGVEGAAFDEPETEAPIAPESPEVPQADAMDAPPPPASLPASLDAFVLPGESLAKYRGPQRRPEPPALPPPPPRAARPAPPVNVAPAPAPAPVPSLDDLREERGAAFSPMVLPGESLAKYRHQAPARVQAASGPIPADDVAAVAASEAAVETVAPESVDTETPLEIARQSFEHERSQPDSPAEASPTSSDEASEEQIDEPIEDQVERQVDALEAAADEDADPADADASASHSDASPAARMQAPGRGNRGRHRRRRGGRGHSPAPETAPEGGTAGAGETPAATAETAASDFPEPTASDDPGPESLLADAAPVSEEESAAPATAETAAEPRRGNRDGRDNRRGGRGREGREPRGEGRGEPRGEGRGESRGEGRGESRGESRSEGKNESGPNSRLIGDLLHEGQEILIQIAKEPLGKKGARITSHLALPGRFLVYMPTVHHIGVSRKISSDEERARLKRLILENSQDLPGGFIVRTAGAGASDEEFKADIRLLASQWNEMRQQFEKVKSPALLHHDLNLVERILRDQLSDEFTHIWVDTDEQYQRIVKFVSYFMPHLVNRVRLYTRDEPLFEHFGIQEEINKALKSKVWLKSGGYIVLNQTEALVAIDVNTGKYVGKSNRLEDTIVKTNVDAIKEIVRQIRLRDLGGIIVIDFIDMDERRNRVRVMQALEEAMRADRAPSKILTFNDFGLVALTRKRVKQSLERTLGSACPYCTGVGLVKSPTTVCNEIYTEVKKAAPTIEREDLVLRVNPEIAKTLKGQNAQRLREMEEVSGKTISVRPDPQVHQEQFEIY